MKKNIILTFVIIFVIIAGAVNVSAVTRQTLINQKTSISKGGSFSKTSLKANYNNPEIDITIDSVTSGTTKNVFMVSRYEDGKYKVKTVETFSIIKYSCLQRIMKSVGKGNWMYTNAAFDAATGDVYAGWAGTTKFYSI